MNISLSLIFLGSLFFIALLAHGFAKKLGLPRITLLLLLGFLFGPSGFGFISEPTAAHWFPAVTKIALGMVGFLIGGTLSHTQLKQLGLDILIISMCLLIMTFAIVTLGMFLALNTLTTSLLLACIAIATAPAATTDVIHEMKAKGKFSKTILGVVAIDDLWALFSFSLILVFINGPISSENASSLLWHGVIEVFGGLGLGLVLGIPVAYISGRIAPGEPSLVEALGAVFLCTGLALQLKLSFLLATMAMGVSVTNLAKHHTRPFHAIESIEWPFMIVFFILAGASLQINALHGVGILGLLYVLLRTFSRILGSALASLPLSMNFRESVWLGLALLPQAGVPLGMALVAVEKLPEIKNIIIPIVLSASVIFELIGPILTKHAILNCDS